MAPNPNCAICRDTYTTVHCDPARTTLREVVDGILGPGEGLGTGPRDVGVYEAGRILADPDFEDNLDRTLADLNCGRGKFITIVDEEGEYGTINMAICLLPYVSLGFTIIGTISTPILTPKTTAVTPIYRRPMRHSLSFPTHYPLPRSSRGRKPHPGRHTSGRRGKAKTTTMAGSSRLVDPDRRRRNSRGQQMGTHRRSMRITLHPRCGSLKRTDWCSWKRMKRSFWIEWLVELGRAGKRRLDSLLRDFLLY